jgi:hypothetical protein
MSDEIKGRNHRLFTINLTLNWKASKESLDFAQREADRLHQLITSGNEVEWAKKKLSELHKMIFQPDASTLQHEIERKLAAASGPADQE